MRKKTALGLLGLLLTMGLVVGAGANFRDYTATRSVHWDVVADDNELVQLIPLQPYAYINENGLLVVDISPDNPNFPGYGLGLSPKSEYNFDEMFGVKNALWENMTIVVRITSTNPSIQFYGADKNIHDVKTGKILPASDYAKNDVCFTLKPDQMVKVGMDFTVGNDPLNTTEKSAMIVQAYRLGTEPPELVGKCGQP